MREEGGSDSLLFPPKLAGRRHAVRVDALSLPLTLIKKKIKFSSYIGKFKVEQLQSHI
jgi:hypothetical protein